MYFILIFRHTILKSNIYPTESQTGIISVLYARFCFQIYSSKVLITLILFGINDMKYL